MRKVAVAVIEKERKYMEILLSLSILGFLGGSVKNLPAMWETRVRALGREDPLEKAMATHSSILAREISWTEEPGRLQTMVLEKQKVGHD